MLSNRSLQLLSIVCLAFVLAACGGSTSGGGDDDGGTGNSGGGGGTGGNTGGGGTEQPTDPIDAGVNVVAASNNLPSNASSADQGVEITAIVRNSQNNVVEGQTVSFSADSGVLQVTQPTTGAAGAATAILTTGGDPRNRTITVTARSGSASDTVEVEVVGTQLSVAGPAALGINETATYTASLTDASGDGIANRTVMVRSENGNTLSMNSAETNSEGEAQVRLTATNSGTDTLTVEALGQTAQTQVEIAGDNFQFTDTDNDRRVALDQQATVQLRWLNDGRPVAGETINFSTTRGNLGSDSDTTDGQGRASVSISSNDAGPATITASSDSGLQASTSLQFIATDPDSIDIQADPATVAPNGQSAITAVVRDDNNNLVTGQTINFTLSDNSGGSLSDGSAITNINGRASTTYTAGNTSATQPATITATVADEQSISANVNVTIGGQALRITLGTGNELQEPDSTTYRLPYVALVTDANGTPVSDANFRLTIESLAYQKGRLNFVASDDPDQEDRFEPFYTAPRNAANFGCANEDANGNGVLDGGEDTNSNGRLEPGNVASVPSTADLDDEGIAEFEVTYPQNFALWVKVRLRAIAEVQGTETTSIAEFILPVLQDEIDEASDTPPNRVSPFGTGGSCVDAED